jgi:predicted aspartyl protease
MMKRIELILLLLVWINISSFGQAPNPAFSRIYTLIEQKNFFKAREVYDQQKQQLSRTHQQYTEVFLDNAFNRLEASNTRAAQLLGEGSLPDSLRRRLLEIKKDNHVKLYEYREAKVALETILKDYRQLLSEEELKDAENELKIWTALEDEPRQETYISETVRLKMVQDKAGLKNLKIANGTDTVDFIFDTGANLSTVTRSTAQRLGMKMIPVDIQVGTITGEEVTAQLAVCPSFRLGSIEIRNAVILVLEDEGLAFAPIDYQIHGIIGYPVIEALREIQITKDGYFVVPKEETQTTFPSNLAMSGLTPLIYINQRHFWFDTGADQTMFYYPYYAENRRKIDKKYKPQKVHFAGAGGKKEFDGFRITVDLTVGDKQVTLKDIKLLKEQVKDSETAYGNIGQDLIGKFNKMTLNLDRMFVKFD